jgi:hypothetical protein
VPVRSASIAQYRRQSLGQEPVEEEESMDLPRECRLTARGASGANRHV